MKIRLIIISGIFLTAFCFAPRSVCAQSQVFVSNSLEREVLRFDVDDGSNTRTAVVDGLHGLGQVTVDTVNGRVYWTDEIARRIRRTGLDGTNLTTIKESFLIGQTVDYVRGVDIDAGAGKMYWCHMATNTGGEIRRANLDGSAQEVLVGLQVCSDLALDLLNGKIYWTYNTTFPGAVHHIRRSNLDGTNVQNILVALNNPIEIEVDSAGGKIYWTDIGTDKIQRANLDGTVVQDVQVGFESRGIALDITNGKIYWSDQTNDVVRRSNLDGTVVEDVLLAGLTDPKGLAIDSANAKLYLIDEGPARYLSFNTDGTNVQTLAQQAVSDIRGIGADSINDKIYFANGTSISRMNADGSSMEHLVTGLTTPTDVVVDAVNQLMYWLDSGTSKLQRANTDGSNTQDLIVALNLGGSTRPRITLDYVNDKLYWTNSNTGRIVRANIDGTNVQDVIIGLATPKGIDIDSINGIVYWGEGGAVDRIKRANIDGTNIQILRALQSDVTGEVALDLDAGKAYWTDRNIFVGANMYIGSSNLDGSGAVVAMSAGLVDNITVTEDIAVLDNAPPAAAVVNSQVDNQLLNTNTPTFSGTAELLATVTVLDNGSSLGSAIADISGVWSFTPGTALAEGTRAFTFVVSDRATNTNSDTALSLSIDVTAPNVPALAPGRDFVSNMPTISGTAEANASVDIFIDNLFAGNTVANGSGVWTFVPGTALSKGTHTITVRATDATGNISAFSSDQEFTIEDSFSDEVHFFWNGFYDFINIVTAVNTDSSSNMTIMAELRDENGLVLDQQPFTVPANGNIELIANNMSGFNVNRTGLVTLKLGQDSIEGYGAYYKFDESYTNVEMSLLSPYQFPMQGETFNCFNTFQPSLNPADTGSAVLNWVQIANLNTLTPKTFEIRIYDQSGVDFFTSFVTIPAMGRRDVRVQNPAVRESVGLVRIIPVDPTASYLAQISRYGTSAKSDDDNPAPFHFSVVSAAQTGQITPFWVPVSAGGNGQNWLAIANTGAITAYVQLEIYTNAGGSVFSDVLTLDAHAQLHIEASDFLPTNESGAAYLRPLSGTVLAESVYYFRDQSGGLTSAYQMTGRTLSGSESVGEYNLFLEQLNYLRLFNTSNLSVNAEVTIYDTAGSSLGSVTRTLAPLTGEDLELNALSFAPLDNTVGKLKMDASSAGVMLADIVRVRAQGNTLDSAAAVPVR